MDYEALNRYVLIVAGLFGVLLYVGVLYGGFVEFRKGTTRKRNRMKGSQPRRSRRMSQD